ncbi:MAG: hypothetical protein Ct9H300mP16_01700 [Pseudomonadota bacterium]|nr:MAG: hypothetical protein Ct9H300mP16_01700 [Pseudomonadota bacterium]
MESSIPRLPPNAHRWIGEMEEIATTFAGQGVTPHFHLVPRRSTGYWRQPRLPMKVLRPLTRTVLCLRPSRRRLPRFLLSPAAKTPARKLRPSGGPNPQVLSSAVGRESRHLGTGLAIAGTTGHSSRSVGRGRSQNAGGPGAFMSDQALSPNTG